MNFKKFLTSIVLATALVSGSVSVPGLIESPKAEANFLAPMYKQTDSRWSGDIMAGNETIGDIGCAMTSIAMALKFKNITIYGADTTPKNLNSWLKSNSGYDSGGNIYWESIEKLNSSRITFQGRYYGGTTTSLSSATLRSYLDAGNKAIIAQVRNGTHWVLLRGHNGGLIFAVNDPAYSNTSYANTDFTGFAVYTIN